MSFAVKMYNWTRMGARVFVTPGTISPESFSHPLLVTQKVAPQQPVADDILTMDAPLGVKSDKGADKPQTGLDLRTSVGHVFTAQVDKTDANLLRWSVVTLPTRNTARINVEERASHRRKVAAAAVAEAKPQPVTNSPAEALDRISIPADVMARISEALGTGGSIIVSDLGVNQGETGEGTDFILPLR